MAINPKDKEMYEQRFKDEMRKLDEMPGIPFAETGKAYSHKNCGLAPEPLTPDTMPMLKEDA
jgi:hypothetical protein